jgi:hypothetical protein
MKNTIALSFEDYKASRIAEDEKKFFGKMNLKGYTDENWWKNEYQSSGEYQKYLDFGIFATTTSNPEGWIIKDCLGFISAFSFCEENNIERTVKDVVAKIKIKAFEAGGNVVVDLNLEHTVTPGAFVCFAQGTAVIADKRS